MTSFFKDIAPIRYEGRDSANPFAFRHYGPDGGCQTNANSSLPGQDGCPLFR